MLYWEKHDHEKNLHLWYCVTYGRDLLGDLTLTRTWGGVGHRGHREVRLLLTADSELRGWLYRIGRKLDAKGYALEVRSMGLPTGDF